MKKSTLILIISLITNISISACSCKKKELDLPIAEFGLLSVDSRINTSFDDLIFQGNLISSQRVEIEEIRHLSKKEKRQHIELKFEVVKPFKGDNINEGDTILIYTFGGCGFYSPIRTKSIIFASSIGRGKYVTYRGDCCRSVSEADDKTRYDQYMLFINVVTNKIDGKYVFKQPKSYWNGGYINKNYDMPQIQFEIINGEFNSLWKVTNRSGLVIEEGRYLNVKRVGKWVFRRVELDPTVNYEYGLISEVQIKYKKGRPQRKIKKLIKINLGADTETEYIEKTRIKW